MPSYVCVIECQAADESVADRLEDLAGEHVYELETEGRVQAEREALDHFFTAHPDLQRLGDRVDVAVTVRRKRQGERALAEPRRGRLVPRERSEDPAPDDAPDRIGDDETE